MTTMRIRTARTMPRVKNRMSKREPPSGTLLLLRLGWPRGSLEMVITKLFFLFGT